MAKKKYLLDTNILMKYPLSPWGFDDNEVIVTAMTVEELDNNKNKPGDTGFQARTALRKLDELRAEAVKQGTKLSEGVKINETDRETFGVFRIVNSWPMPEEEIPQGWAKDKPDNMIIMCAKALDAILISEDKGVCIKSDEIGLESQSYKNVEIDVDTSYTGRGEIYLPTKLVDMLAEKDGVVNCSKIECGDKFTENEYFIVRDAANPEGHTVLAKYQSGFLTGIRETSNLKDCKIKPRNVGQKFALDALLDENIPLTILKGQAGTAKTFLAITAGMQGLKDGLWDRIIVTRNNVTMDDDIGFLPGDEQEKLGPLVRGVTDNLATYFRLQGHAERDIPVMVEDYLTNGMIDVEGLGYMRGRSISNAFIIFDEAQNSTPHQIKSVITRLGENCYACITGDDMQIDNVKLDRKNCGLTYASERMKGSALCAQITFNDDECVRSLLAKEAAERMAD